MLKKMFLPLIFIALFAVVPALAGNECKKGNFVGVYTSPTLNQDVFGDGTEVHSYTFQMTLNSDGAANLYWTGFNDYFTNQGTGSPSIGSWTCRNDGKLIVTWISAAYLPSTPTANAPYPDVTLLNHRRTTILFTIENNNTLRRTQARTRFYTPAQDPTNPTGGTLSALNTAQFVYTRLEASDADLLAP